MENNKLKIIFWAELEAGQISLELEQWAEKTVKAAIEHVYIRDLDMKLSLESNPQKLGEEEFDARLEFTLIIENPRTDRLPFLMYFFTEFFGNEQDKDDRTYAWTFVPLSNDFFGNEFSSAHMELPMRNISFLNIIERRKSIIHYRERAPQLDTRGIMSKFYNKSIKYPMMVDFEHDRRQFFVRFPYTMKQRIPNSDKPPIVFEYVVAIQVRNKTIRRIIARVINDAEVDNGRSKLALELNFHLSSPPVIRRIDIPPQVSNKSQSNLLTKQGHRYTIWDKADKLTEKYRNCEINHSPFLRLVIYDIEVDTMCALLTRLNVTSEKRLEFRTLSGDHYIPYRDYLQDPLEDEQCCRIFQNDYRLMYMIAALLSRGAVVKDYLMVDKNLRDKFVYQCANNFFGDPELTLDVMERVLAEIDERVDCRSPLDIYQRQYNIVSRNADTLKQIYDDNSKEGYVKVRKIVVTPTRILFVAPELLMGNRVLRLDPVNFPLEKFLRIVFRDDDGQSVHANNVGDKLIDIFIGKKLGEGLAVARRHFNYFGSSNSQLRDNGCYFINASIDDIASFRQKLGSFKIQSAPKMMARLGQCFTQARETPIELGRESYATSHDFEGGQNRKGAAYNFSDGVGRISRETAKQLGKELKLDGCIPSCFQIRFRGFKGVLSVDPTLDEKKEWGKKNRIKDKTNLDKNDPWLDLKIAFRPSQKKFTTMRENQRLEIVKHSAPVLISLNRPVINILDQVSAIQGSASHQRICSRIHLLMDQYLHSLTKSLIDETRARNKLGEFPKVILYDQLTNLNLTNEPFFRSLIRASVMASLKKLRQKLQIPIPTHLGRAMFGVADESGQLQYGQVFIQYTKNSTLKLPGNKADKQVLTGRVMITKNPSIVAGDIRMFEAVDIPALHHLCDVVVFPRYGPRPHSDEMAGSDLDGDEYSIMWDEHLYLEDNEKAFDYTSRFEEKHATTEEELRTNMIKFFVDYVKQDSIGRIANAFLINSDLFGINSEVCQAIARKHMDAVDFPKTGEPPKPLTKNWGAPKNDDDELPPSDEETFNIEKALNRNDSNMPPERPERAPDFMEKSNEPTYISPRLNGQLYRRAKEIDDILTLATFEEEAALVECDKYINVDGWEQYSKKAQEHYDAYAAHIQAVLDSYGIKSEGELFSGHFISLKNRLSDKDSDDMSFYNTTNAIEQRLFAVFGKFRRQFFETSLIGNKYRYEDVTMAASRYARTNGAKEVFRRVCSDPSDEMKKLACAYYKITYGEKTRRLLSFPWLAWDVVNTIRRSNCSSVHKPFSFDPLSEKISRHIIEYINERKKMLKKFRENMQDYQLLKEDEQKPWGRVFQYCDRYKGLDKLMLFCIRWAWHNGILDRPFTKLHICILLLQFGLNHHPCELIDANQFWLEPIDSDSQEKIKTVNLNKQFGGLGKKFMLFMEFLASRQFEILPFIDFNKPKMGFKSIFYQKQWDALHKAALKTFHQVAFTFRLETLPKIRERKDAELKKPENLLGEKLYEDVEGEPFVIEVPFSHLSAIVNNDELENRLCNRTKCSKIKFRPLPQNSNNKDTVRIYVSSKGPIEALSKLRSELSIRPNLNLSKQCRKMTNLMAAAVYERLRAEK